MSGTEYRITPQQLDDMTISQVMLYFEPKKLTIEDAIRIAKRNASKGL